MLNLGHFNSLKNTFVLDEYSPNKIVHRCAPIISDPPQKVSKCISWGSPNSAPNYKHSPYKPVLSLMSHDYISIFDPLTRKKWLVHLKGESFRSILIQKSLQFFVYFFFSQSPEQDFKDFCYCRYFNNLRTYVRLTPFNSPFQLSFYACEMHP